jgi:hypothetical protein
MQTLLSLLTVGPLLHISSRHYFQFIFRLGIGVITLDITFLDTSDTIIIGVFIIIITEVRIIEE